MQAKQPKRWGRRILLGVVGFLALAFIAYHVALAAYAPDPAKLSAWRSDFEGALAEAKTTGKLIVLKAGSRY